MNPNQFNTYKVLSPDLKTQTTSILNNKKWQQIETLLSGKTTDRGVTARDNRTFVEAVL
jgi:hypothetical protein